MSVVDQRQRVVDVLSEISAGGDWPSVSQADYDRYRKAIDPALPTVAIVKALFGSFDTACALAGTAATPTMGVATSPRRDYDEIETIDYMLRLGRSSDADVAALIETYPEHFRERFWKLRRDRTALLEPSEAEPLEADLLFAE